MSLDAYVARQIWRSMTSLGLCCLGKVPRGPFLCALWLTASVVLSTSSAQAAGKATVYPPPAGLLPSAEYSVRVDGKPVFVYDNPSAAIVSFDVSGEVDVEIQPKRDVKWVDIRPRQRGVRGRIEDGRIEFSLSRPAKLSVELNGEFKSGPRKPLFVFANATESNPLEGPSPGVHYFGPGKVHDMGVLQVQSGETVYIAGGAVVKGAIRGVNVKDVTVRGHGIIDASQHPEPADGEFFRFIDFRDSQNITVEGVTLSNATSWQVIPDNVDGFHVRNVKIVSNNPTDDGIDIVRSRHVLIEDVFVHTKDDCIAIKAFGPGAGGPEDPGVDDVRVIDSVFWNTDWGNALEIGFELRSPFVQNITFHNNDIIRVERGAVFAIHNADVATVRNVLVDRLRIEDARHKLFDLAIVLSKYSVDAPKDPQESERRYLHGAWDGVLTLNPVQRQAHASARGQIRDITLRNVEVTDGLFPFSLFHGYDEQHRIRNVSVENLRVHGAVVRGLENGRFRLHEAEGIRVVSHTKPSGRHGRPR